jgi:hypothetical protein
MELTPSHTVGNKLHENQSLDSILHTQVFHQTNGCSNQKQLSLHLPHGETVAEQKLLTPFTNDVTLQNTQMKRLTLIYTLPTKWSPKLSHTFISSISPY